MTDPDDLRTLLTAVALLLILLAPLLLALPVDECSACVHCTRKRAQAVIDQTPCPIHRIPQNRCGKWHDKE